MYNFVFFGISNDFYRHSFADLRKLTNVKIRKDIYENRNKIIYYMYRMHTFPYMKLRLPFTSVWDKVSYQSDFDNDNPLCFVFMPKHANRYSYLKLLRNKYDDCKLIMMFRDRVDRNLEWFPNLNIDEIKKNFDIVYSYNKYDCEKYGFEYFNTEATKEDLKPKDFAEWSDVVFIGNVKGRLEKINAAYHLFHNNGLKTDFYVVGAENKEKYDGPGIIFADKGITYAEMLERTINSRCILEISQEGEYGFTSRSQEAFMYNKKLITDSLIVKEQPFYSTNNVFFFNSVSEIDPAFVSKEVVVDYGYSDEYSPIRIVEQIEKELVKN